MKELPTNMLSADLLREYRRFSIFAGAATVFIGLLAFCSSEPALDWLKTTNPTAFLLTGVAILALNAPQSAPVKWAGRVTAGLLAVLCIAEICSFVFDSAGTGALSDIPTLGAVTGFFGLMPPSDAIGFLLLALALLTMPRDGLWDRRGKTQSRSLRQSVPGSAGFQPASIEDRLPDAATMPTLPGTSLREQYSAEAMVLPLATLPGGFTISELFSLVALFSSIMTLIGVTFAVPNFCLLISCLKISPYDAAAFILPCSAILTARPESGAFAIMSSATAGGDSARRLIPAAILIPLVLGSLKMAAESAHLIDSDVGLTLAMLAMIILYMGLLLTNAISLDRMDRQRIAANAKLEQSEKRIKAIVHQASDAFVAVDSDGTVRQWNAQASAMFGVPETDAVGKKLSQLICQESQRDSLDQLFKQNSRADVNARKPFELVLSHLDGHEIPAEIALFQVFAEEEQMVCAFMRDITERKAIEARFRDFYFTVSHELRSPLTSIQGSITLTQKDPDSKLTKRAEQLLKAADDSAKRLIKLINDLLDVKRIEAGKLRLHVELIDPLEVASLSIQNLEGVATLHSVTVESVVTSANEVEGDLDRLVQVLTNILSNALKFSPQGSTVVVNISDTEDGGVRFAVTDQGPGVPEEALTRIFSRFEQSAMVPSFKQVSSGLGLSIAKAIVEEHGGRINVDSTVGQGATFWFKLPAAKTSNLMPNAPAQPPLLR